MVMGALRCLRDATLALVFVFIAVLNRILPSSSTSLKFFPFVKMVDGHGYPVETHEVITKDGYKLTMFRIPHGRDPTTTPRPVVMLQHGLLDSAYTWICDGPTKSLAYLLADKGFDVWIPNNRGNIYSRSHVYLETRYEEYWQFSYDEMGIYDLPANIDYVLQATGVPQLSYIGHSEGTTQVFVGLSTNPKLAAKLNCFIGLGPVASVGSINNKLVSALARFRVVEILMALGFRRSFTGPPHGFIRWVMARFLYAMPWVFDDLVAMLCGPEQGGWKWSRDNSAEMVERAPAGTSMANMLHWTQAMRIGQNFQMLDLGARDNMRMYRSPTPPVYHLDRVPQSLPKLLMYGTADAFVDQSDVMHLASELQVDSASLVKIEEYNHTDYLWDPSATSIVYPRVYAFLDKHTSA